MTCLFYLQGLPDTPHDIEGGFALIFIYKNYAVTKSVHLAVLFFGPWIFIHFKALEKFFHVITHFKGAVMFEYDVGHIFQVQSQSDLPLDKAFSTV